GPGTPFPRVQRNAHCTRGVGGCRSPWAGCPAKPRPASIMADENEVRPMFDFLSHLFDTTGFPPRWYCGAWTSGHGWLHILSDLGVWSAYVAIPCVLGYFVLRRRDIPFRPIFWLFAAFILACGTTHLMEAALFWWPAYRLAGLIKLVTALVSWATVL